MTDTRTCVSEFIEDQIFYRPYTCWANGGRRVGSVLNAMNDTVALGVSESEKASGLSVGCLHVDACNYDSSVDLMAPAGHPDECWYPFDNVNYECGDIRTTPLYDEYSQAWRPNPGKCKHRDDDNNGWCDDLDEVFGCLDVTACNSAISEHPRKLRKTLGSPCSNDLQCLTGRCAYCDGEYKCSRQDNDQYGNPNCIADKRNYEIITRTCNRFVAIHIVANSSVKTMTSFSSLQGVEISLNNDTSLDAYIKSDRETRERMIRCIDIPDAKGICDTLNPNLCNIVQTSSKSGTKYLQWTHAVNGGGRVFDTSRGEPLFDALKNGRPTTWQREGCVDPAACNFNPFADPVLTAENCKYNDVNNDGVCDDIFFSLRKNVMSFLRQILKNILIHKSTSIIVYVYSTKTV